ncbi:MAG: sugar phosphate nucleotidyltransferase [Candidatus Binatia bacterium]
MANASLKAVILAAGKGTRMKELTAEMPKPMLKVAGKPVLEHIVRGLGGAGITDLCIITGYHAEAVEEFLGDGSRFGVQISYARQKVQDGTGKAPELTTNFVGDSNFVLMYGDILVDPTNYKRMAHAFTVSKAAGLISAIKNQDVTKGAAVTFDDAFFMMDLVEKPPKGANLPPWYNAGIYMFSPVVFRYTARLQKSPRGEYELPDALRAMIADGHRIKGFELKGYWIDVRDPDMLRAAERLLRPE